jgi:hypothetical protein
LLARVPEEENVVVSKQENVEEDVVVYDTQSRKP